MFIKNLFGGICNFLGGIRDFLGESFATFLYTGYARQAPGTASAFTTLLIFVGGYFITLQKGEIALPAFDDFLIVSAAVLFIGGLPSVAWFMKVHKEHDPREVVIDEAVGMLLTLWLVFPYFNSILVMIENNVISVPMGYKMDYLVAYLIYTMSSFAFFRIFDIWKPWPINLIDQKMTNSLGVMLDDIVAAIFAAGVNISICYAFIYLA